MLKKLMIGAIAVAAMAAPMAASAQSRHHDRDRDGRYEQWERRADRNRHDGGRYTHRERYNDYRRGQRDQRRDYRRDYRNTHWGRGQVLPYDYRSRWYVNDYRRYGYRAPPRGYGYYRTDSGDIVLAAIATGVIISLLSN
jgi:Ni/Co efflux regulator RcnB